MCVITDEADALPINKIQTGFLVCQRCDAQIETISERNQECGHGYLCLDCSAIARRRETVVYDYDFELAKPDRTINKLVLACEAALLLRGLWAAVNDPLALKGEKEEYRSRFKEIESQIRDAIKQAKDDVTSE